MITDFDDLCLWTYVIVDDMLIKLVRRPGPPPQCSDSELITMIIAECKGWDIETQLLSEFSQHPNLFPILPSQTRFNRRRRNSGAIITGFDRCSSDIEGASEKLCIIDSADSSHSVSSRAFVIVTVDFIEETDHFRL